jgi:predicted phosphodiesterase
MIKTRLLSDLHREGYNFKYNHYGEDMLILAGDITNKNRLHDFLDEIYDTIGHNLMPILFVPGNHEYYHGTFQEVNSYFKNLEHPYPNFHFLNNSGVEIENVRFFGGTMFTDFLLYGETDRWFAEHDAKQYIADFKYIKINRPTLEDLGAYETWYWTIQDHKNEYEKFNREFDHWVKINEGKKRVCISHFMPSEKCVHPRWEKSNLNSYFACNNENRVQLVDLWICGHTHDSFNGMVGDTPLIINPRGYGSENQLDFNEKLILEI